MFYIYPHLHLLYLFKEKQMNSMAETAVLAAVSVFSGNENKALLWSVLHGGGKFIGIPDTQVPVIKEIFEQTIYNMSEHCRRSSQPLNLNAMNKEAVVIICNKLEAVKMQQSQQQRQQPPYQNPLQQIYQKKQQQIPQLETIYRAEDVQKERQNAFQAELKKKEEEMSSILKLKKPEEINFTDDVYDKPIGDDMERLLAEALASRERELEQIKNVAFAAQPPPPSPLPDSYKVDKTVARRENAGIEKRVSFETELHVIENGRQQNDNENNDERVETNDEGDISFIFNKLKKIKIQKNDERRNENNENNENDEENNVYENNNNSREVIIKMSQDIEYIKNTLAELLEKVNKL